MQARKKKNPCKYSFKILNYITNFISFIFFFILFCCAYFPVVMGEIEILVVNIHWNIKFKWQYIHEKYISN